MGHEHSADGNIHCNQQFVIKTDPQNCDYELAMGLERIVDTWDPKDSETMELVSSEERREMQSNPMIRLEKTIRNEAKELDDKQRLRALAKIQKSREDTYSLN